VQEAIFRFYEELNDLLAPQRRRTDFRVEFNRKESVKDMIEALGVPHTEVDLILVNGRSVDFNHFLQDKDRISVYPLFESLNIQGLTRLREFPLRKTRFVADTNIGDIVKYMRVLGFDVYCDTSLSPRQVVEVSNREKRIIVTKSRKLLKFKEVSHGVLICPGTVQQQIEGIINRLDIRDDVRPFSRCLCCNNLLIEASKKMIEERVPPKARASCDGYSYCESCDKVFWKGTHHIKMTKVIGRILKTHNERVDNC